MKRNKLLLRSLLFGVMTKSVGFFVVFACFPLAALTLTTAEYAAFNFSMAVTGLLSLGLTPIAMSYVVRFSEAASANDCPRLTMVAEESLSLMLALGILLLPLTIGVAYALSPTDYRLAIAAAAAMVLLTNIFSWGEIFRLGIRMDYITSLFGLGSNATVILGFVILFRYNLLSFRSVIALYYFSPLIWGAASFFQIIHSRRFRPRFNAATASRWRGPIAAAGPIFTASIADYLKLYVSSVVAFYLSTPQAYSLFSTALLLIARLSNPLSLLARPLIPAYVDAVARTDRRWLSRVRHMIVAAWVLGILGVGVTACFVSLVPQKTLRLGVIVLPADEVGLYLTTAGLLFLSTAISIILASVYLATHRMRSFSNVCLATNLIAISAGAALTALRGPELLFSSIAVGATIACGYLTSKFVRFSSVVEGTARSKEGTPC